MRHSLEHVERNYEKVYKDGPSGGSLLKTERPDDLKAPVIKTEFRLLDFFRVPVWCYLNMVILELLVNQRSHFFILSRNIVIYVMHASSEINAGN